MLKPQVIKTQTRTLAPRVCLETAMLLLLLVEIQVLAMVLVVLDRVR
jgi:hypothetical protein